MSHSPEHFDPNEPSAAPPPPAGPSSAEPSGQSPAEPSPAESSPGGSTPPLASMEPTLDAFIDQQLLGAARSAFEARISSDATLAADCRRQRAIDASLQRLFAAPPIDAADRVLDRAMAQLRESSPPAEARANHNGRATTMDRAAAAIVLADPAASTSTSRPARQVPPREIPPRDVPARHVPSRQPMLRGWMKVAAAITLLIGVPSALWLWRDTLVPPPDPYAHAKVIALDELYREQVSSGFKPDWVCKDQREFAAYFANRFGQPLMLRDASAGAAMLGLSYTGGVTKSSMGMLGTADGKSVLVVIDQAGNDAKVKMSHPDGLHLFRRQVGTLMLYEITPLEGPKLLDLFYQPPAPTSAQACG